MATPEPHKVYVVGGGLAGMTVAHELAKQGVAVTILESAGRLGGKAGAQVDAELGIAFDHGFHIFPRWYANVRGLLDELGLSSHLIETDRQHTIERRDPSGRPGRWFTNYAVNSLGRVVHNLRNSPMRWYEALIGIYFLLDLAAESFDRRGFLDRVSVNGFFRSKWYRSEAVANFQHFLGLQATSIPGDAISAMTFQTVVKGFMQDRSVLVGMLEGDLQSRFIAPFQKRLEELGVRIVLNQPVCRLALRDGRVCGLGAGVQPQLGRSLADDGSAGAMRSLDAELGLSLSAGDIYVLATPPERTRQFLDDGLYAIDREGLETHDALAGLNYLTSEPMAALHVVFKRRLAHIPPWHASMYHSRYGLSMIDISQHWPELQQRDQTILSVIAADFKPLAGLTAHEQTAEVLRDLLDYLRYDADGREVITDSDIAAVRLNPNTDVPLFLNTTCAWHYRPDAATRISNLFVAGDYCRSQADLTTMESAVYSGLRTAQRVLEAIGKDPRRAVPRRFETTPRWRLLLGKYSLLPLIAPIGLIYLLRRKLVPPVPDGF